MSRQSELHAELWAQGFAPVQLAEPDPQDEERLAQVRARYTARWLRRHAPRLPATVELSPAEESALFWRAQQVADRFERIWGLA